MRELKFRAWDKSVEHLYEVQTLIDGGDAIGRYVLNGEMNYIHLCADEIIVEQYTGLKDRNGKEIYEGDIVEQFVCGVHQFKGKECGRKTLWQVRWNEEECCFELHYLSGSLFGDSMMSKGEEYVVIGNIHENPELLEEEE